MLFFILMQMTMLVLGTFWLVLGIFEVSENHYLIASTGRELGPNVALSSLAKKWEVESGRSSKI